LENENTKVSILGEPVEIGRLRTFFTNVTVELIEIHTDGRSVMKLKGSGDTMRIVEAF